MDERHLFILDKSLFETIPLAYVNCEVDAVDFPSSSGRMRFPLDSLDNWWSGMLRNRVLGDIEFDWTLKVDMLVGVSNVVGVCRENKRRMPFPLDGGPEQPYLLKVCHLALRLMCVSLSITNIERQSRPGHALRTAKKSIKPARYTHVTTIRVPNVKYLPADEDHPPTGRSVRAHLRRGHSRMQHHGPLNSLTKQVQIAPTFVKVDADFVPGPKTYRLVGVQNGQRSSDAHGRGHREGRLALMDGR